MVEMSPNTGWSTTWCSNVFCDKGANGQRWSYDLPDIDTTVVPKTLSY